MGRPERNYNTVVFGYDSDYAFAAEILKSLYLGPGEPGPGDEWKMPAGPANETIAVAEEPPTPARSGRLSRLKLLGRKG